MNEQERSFHIHDGTLTIKATIIHFCRDLSTVATLKSRVGWEPDRGGFPRNGRLAYVIQCQASGDRLVTPLRSKKRRPRPKWQKTPSKGVPFLRGRGCQPPRPSILHAHSSAREHQEISGKTDEARIGASSPDSHLIRCRPRKKKKQSWSSPLPLPSNLDWIRPTRSLLAPRSFFLWIHTAHLMAGDRLSTFRRDRSADPFPG
jgi:hypothetical protein